MKPPPVPTGKKEGEKNGNNSNGSEGTTFSNQSLLKEPSTETVGLCHSLGTLIFATDKNLVVTSCFGPSRIIPVHGSAVWVGRSLKDAVAKLRNKEMNNKNTAEVVRSTEAVLPKATAAEVDLIEGLSSAHNDMMVVEDKDKMSTVPTEAAAAPTPGVIPPETTEVTGDCKSMEVAAKEATVVMIPKELELYAKALEGVSSQELFRGANNELYLQIIRPLKMTDSGPITGTTSMCIDVSGSKFFAPDAVLESNVTKLPMEVVNEAKEGNPISGSENTSDQSNEANREGAQLMQLEDDEKRVHSAEKCEA
mmetsp:Transcript_10429/g.17901  ORF Transcript_10429/g.17901 Transcript_10429/m.17901 type:complete len:309 (-) Transcript_10429:265-1191(-)